MIEAWWFDFEEMKNCLDPELFGSDEYVTYLQKIVESMKIDSPTKRTIIEDIIQQQYIKTDLSNSQKIIKILTHHMTLEMLSDGKLSKKTLHLLLTLPQNIADKCVIRSKKKVDAFRNNFEKINSTGFNHGNTSSD
jgi:hypothetical protein